MLRFNVTRAWETFARFLPSVRLDKGAIHADAYQTFKAGVMPAPYTPLAFANEFIARAQGSGIEHMKAQKLVYCAYGWWLAVHDEPVLDEQPQVWRHGPVFRSLYAILKTHGSTRIHHLQSSMFGRSPERVDEGDADASALIDWVWERYRHMTSFQLSDLTHKPGSPWQVTAAEHGYRVPMDTEIPIDRIREHYRQLAQTNGMI